MNKQGYNNTNHQFVICMLNLSLTEWPAIYTDSQDNLILYWMQNNIEWNRKNINFKAKTEKSIVLAEITIRNLVTESSDWLLLVTWKY